MLRRKRPPIRVASDRPISDPAHTDRKTRAAHCNCLVDHFAAAVGFIDSVQLVVGSGFLPQIFWIPRTFTLDNYQSILENPSLPITRWFLNSVLVASIITPVPILAIDSIAAYAYARMEFPGKRILFGLLLATLFLPGVMFLVPNFLTVTSLGLLNNYAVVLPALSGVFGVFFMRQFFELLPRELEEAAFIDGATRLQTFRRSRCRWRSPRWPRSLRIITFLGAWNDFLAAAARPERSHAADAAARSADAARRLYIGVRPDDGGRGHNVDPRADFVSALAALYRRKRADHRVERVDP